AASSRCRSATTRAAWTRARKSAGPTASTPSTRWSSAALPAGDDDWYDTAASRMLRTIGAPFLVALVLALVVIPICRLAATRSGSVASPREARWPRRRVALFGGVGIASVFLFCCAVFGVARHLPVLTITAALTFLVGFVDDVLSLKPATKLIAQIALASTL